MSLPRIAVMRRSKTTSSPSPISPVAETYVLRVMEEVEEEKRVGIIGTAGTPREKWEGEGGVMMYVWASINTHTHTHNHGSGGLHHTLKHGRENMLQVPCDDVSDPCMASVANIHIPTVAVCGLETVRSLTPNSFPALTPSR